MGVSDSIKDRIKATIKETQLAGRTYIVSMYEIGQCVLDQKQLKGYKDLKSAESDIQLMLKGNGAKYCGEDYVKACVLLITKLSDSERAKLLKCDPSPSVEDMVSIAHNADRQYHLEQLIAGKYKKKYGRVGYTYDLKYLMAKKRLKNIPKRISRGIDINSKYGSNPDNVDLAQISHNGEIDEDAVVRVMQNLISRVGLARAGTLWARAMMYSTKNS